MHLYREIKFSTSREGPEAESPDPLRGLELLKCFSDFFSPTFGLVNLNQEEKTDRLMTLNDEVFGSSLSLTGTGLDYLAGKWTLMARGRAPGLRLRPRRQKHAHLHYFLVTLFVCQGFSSICYPPLLF